MDGYDNSGIDTTISQAPIPIPADPRTSRWSGWLVGAIVGVLASLWAFPSVRYTLTAQMEFAMAEDSVPWLSSLDAQRSARELPRLEIVASRFPDDYLLQVGRSTVMAAADGNHSAPVRARSSGTGSPVGAGSAHTMPSTSPPLQAPADLRNLTLARLAGLTRVFSTTPGAYAHLARYLMADRICIRRAELGAPGVAGDVPAESTEISTPSTRSIQIMEWALKSGERLDPLNAFWPTMLATTYFAANRDEEALKALSRASRRSKWDAYIYEEVLGQWRLYSAAYGDHGATQKIGPLSLVVFPHLHEIRRMAAMVRWHAEQKALLGSKIEAARIRRDLERLGVNLRDNAPWAFEALYGTDLFFIAGMDSDTNRTPSSIRTPSEWEPQAVRYHKLLNDIHREYEFKLVRSEVEASCELRKRIDLARFDASYPGIPPGIPLMPLFGNWMAGICLIQQAFGLLLALTLVWIWQIFNARFSRGRPLRRTLALALVPVCTLASGMVFYSSITTPRMAGILLIGLTLSGIAALEGIWQAVPFIRKTGPVPSGSDTSTSVDWSRGTTIRIVILIVLPYLAVLYTHRGELSGLHPVAVLLTSLTGTPRGSDARGALELALLAAALPLLIPLTSALRGLYRGESPGASSVVGLRKLALPCLVCLVVAYSILLNRMLVLDAEASQAIQKAAQNDRQWVLTHGADNPF